jgi:hypothetical protein
MLNITPIVSNINLSEIDVNKNQVVWRALEGSFQDYEIYLFDGSKTIKVSDNQTDQDFAPQVDNGKVVWHSLKGENTEIYLYDGNKTIQLTDNKANDKFPQILDGQVIWYQYELLPQDNLIDEFLAPEEAEIYLYNGEKTIRITDNDLDDRNAQFYGKQVVWEGKETADQGDDYEIFLYENGQTRKLTDNQTEDILKVSKGNIILWTTLNRIDGTQPLFAYNGVTTKQLTTTDYYESYATDGNSVVWIENGEVFLYDNNTTKQITNDGLYKTSVNVSGNKIVWTAYTNDFNSYDTEVFLYNGSTIAQLTDNNDSELNLQIDGENIVWEVYNYDYNLYRDNTDIYIYRNNSVSLIAGTEKDERIFSLSGNHLIGYIDNPYSYSGSEQIFLASWTDDTFPRLDHPEQYGASYGDLIEDYGYNLEAFNQHYRQHGIAEGRSRDSFDEYKYLASNPDLIGVLGEDGGIAARHYIEDGYEENRPLDTFDALQYIASYYDLIYQFGGGGYYYVISEPDLAGATRQYVEDGYSEERNVDTFDEISYLAANPDLFAAFGSDLERATKHYVQQGFYEFRPLIFDASSYLASNPDLIDQLNGDRTLATQHYMDSGYGEGRPIYSFDAIQYIASYQDLILNFGTGGDTYSGIDTVAATDHFVDNGYEEGRVVDRFDEYRYIASNPDDLIFIYNYYYYVDGQGATEHYIRSGSSENRPTTSFDPVAYLQANSDLIPDYNDPTQATLHYIQHGYYEGRPTTI